jgi:hypothetical protein
VHRSKIQASPRRLTVSAVRMSDKDEGSEDKKADQSSEATSSSSKPSMSFSDIVLKYENVKDMYYNFSLKEHVSSWRTTANEYLEKIPKAVLPKIDETVLDVFKRPLSDVSASVHST